MGGFNSGRRDRYERKVTDCDLARVTMREIRRHLPAGRDLTSVTIDNAHVSIAWTPCNYGGRRPWLVCPECGTKRGALYVRKHWVRCRKCWDMSYQSQNDGELDRYIAKAQAIRRRLGGEPALFERFPQRPKGMHRLTYLRLGRLADKYQDRVLELLHAETEETIAWARRQRAAWDG